MPRCVALKVFDLARGDVVAIMVLSGISLSDPESIKNPILE